MGDFNLSYDKYQEKLLAGSRTGRKYQIFDYLTHNNFEDIHPTFSHQGHSYKFHTFSSNLAKTRIDYIWAPSIVAQDNIFSTVLDEPSGSITDHKLVAAYF